MMNTPQTERFTGEDLDFLCYVLGFFEGKLIQEDPLNRMYIQALIHRIMDKISAYREGLQ
jgi:hypothetical protein